MHVYSKQVQFIFISINFISINQFLFLQYISLSDKNLSVVSAMKFVKATRCIVQYELTDGRNGNVSMTQ